MAKLSERDICSKFITPALVDAGWDLHTQIRDEVSFTKGRIVAKVDELMALCDRLKADLAIARQHQATLADTLIAATLEAA